MTWVLVIAGIVVAVLVIRVILIRNLARTMEIATRMVQTGLALRLSKRYAAKMGEEPAAKLAAAVVNEIFAEEPTNAVGREFRAANGDFIQRQLRALADEQEIRHVLTQTIRFALARDYAKKAGVEKTMRRMDVIEKAGILIPGGEAPNLYDFVRLAQDFYNRS